MSITRRIEGPLNIHWNQQARAFGELFGVHVAAVFAAAASAGPHGQWARVTAQRLVGLGERRSPTGDEVRLTRDQASSWAWERGMPAVPHEGAIGDTHPRNLG